MCSDRDSEGPISKYASRPPSWDSIRGICGEGRSIPAPSGCDMTAPPLCWWPWFRLAVSTPRHVPSLGRVPVSLDGNAVSWGGGRSGYRESVF